MHLHRRTYRISVPLPNPATLLLVTTRPASFPVFGVWTTLDTASTDLSDAATRLLWHTRRSLSLSALRDTQTLRVRRALCVLCDSDLVVLRRNYAHMAQSRRELKPYTLSYNLKLQPWGTEDDSVYVHPSRARSS